MNYILLNPGPVNVTPRVRQALLGPDVCHREPEFSNVLRQTRKRLLKLFGISKTHTVALLSGSGTLALESMLVSFASPSKKILVLSNGVYGERIRSILTRLGSPTVFLESSIDEFPSAHKIEAILKKENRIHGIALVHHETSSGQLNPVSAVAALAKKYKKTLLVDAISSIGAEKIDFKKDAIGFVAGSAGKCLHGFPGVSFVIVSKKEALKLKAHTPRSLYLDLNNALTHQETGDTPFTPAVPLFYAFNEALKELAAEGLAQRILSYNEKSSYLEKGLSELGVLFLLRKENRSHVLQALWTPKSISYKTLHDQLKKAGFIIYAGQSSLKGKIFRVSNLGAVSHADLKRFLLTLKQILRKHA